MTPQFALFLFMAPVPVNGASLQTSPVVETSTDLSEAIVLYDEGAILYESADYNGAIDKFTEALGEVRNAGSEDFRVRGMLLYNIGRAHIKAYEIDKDLSHLRQARTIYKRFIKEADVEAMFEQFNPQEVADARKELRALEIRLEGLENTKQTVLPESPSPRGFNERSPVDWKKPRNTGIGLLAGGSAILVGGVAILAVGSTLAPAAEGEVAKLGNLNLPLDHPAWAEGATYITQETKRGKTFMAVGGSLAAVGLIGAGVGVAYLVKARKLREGHVTPTVALTRSFAGIVVSGRF